MEPRHYYTQAEVEDYSLDLYYKKLRNVPPNLTEEEKLDWISARDWRFLHTHAPGMYQWLRDHPAVRDLRMHVMADAFHERDEHMNYMNFFRRGVFNQREYYVARLKTVQGIARQAAEYYDDHSSFVSKHRVISLGSYDDLPMVLVDIVDGRERPFINLDMSLRLPDLMAALATRRKLIALTT